MKRLLSILLSVLLVMGTMTTVVFADEAITFESFMPFSAEEYTLAGSKIIFNVEAEDGANVAYYNNGVAVTPEVMVADVAGDGIFTQTVALTVNSGKNVLTASDGVNTSAAVTINARGVGKKKTYASDLSLICGKNAAAAEYADTAIGGVEDAWKVTTTSGRWGSARYLDGEVVEVSTDIYFDYSSVYGDVVLGFHNGAWANDVCNTAWGGTLSNSGAENPGTKYDGVLFQPYTWHNVKLIIKDVDTGYYDVYVDGILAIKDAKFNNWTTKPSSMQVYFGGDATDGVNYIYRKNYTYSTATFSEAEFTVPEGDVIGNVGVFLRGLSAGDRAVAYVNGVPSQIATADGLYAINLPEGYCSVSVAFINAAGEVYYRSDDAVYYNLYPSGNYVVGTSATFSEDVYTEENVPSNASYMLGKRIHTGINNNTYAGDAEYVWSEKTEGTNNYIQARKWGDLPYAPEGATSKGGGTNNLTSTVGGATGIVTVSADWRLDKLEQLNPDDDNKVAVAYNFDNEYNSILCAPISLTSNNTGMNSAAPIALQLSYYDTGEKTGTLKRPNATPFNYDLTTGFLKCRTDFTCANGTAVTPGNNQLELDVNPGEWHNYKAVFDTVNNKLYLYLDGALVKVGNGMTDTTHNMEASMVHYPSALSASVYGDNNSTKNSSIVYSSLDNFVVDTYAGVNDIVSGDFLNVSANGIGIMPANLDEAAQISDMAIVARAADGSVNINKFDAAASEQEYKFISFNKPASEIFVWAWGNLAPLTEVFEIK